MDKRTEIEEIIEDNATLLDAKFDKALIGYIDCAGTGLSALYDEKILFEIYTFEPCCPAEGIFYLKRSTLEEIAAIDNGEMLTADGLDDAIIGYAYSKDHCNIVIYDTEKCIKILASGYEGEGLSENEMESMAYEYFYYNTVGAYVGERTPGYATVYSDDLN